MKSGNAKKRKRRTETMSTVSELVERARAAQAVLEGYSQEQVE